MKLPDTDRLGMRMKDEIEVMWETDLETGLVHMSPHWRRGIVHKIRYKPARSEYKPRKLVFVVKYYNGPKIEHRLTGCVLPQNKQAPYRLLRTMDGEIPDAPLGFSPLR